MRYICHIYVEPPPYRACRSQRAPRVWPSPCTYSAGKATVCLSFPKGSQVSRAVGGGRAACRQARSVLGVLREPHTELSKMRPCSPAAEAAAVASACPERPRWGQSRLRSQRPPDPVSQRPAPAAATHADRLRDRARTAGRRAARVGRVAYLPGGRVEDVCNPHVRAVTFSGEGGGWGRGRVWERLVVGTGRDLGFASPWQEKKFQTKLNLFVLSKRFSHDKVLNGIRKN